jgi:uncharacterized protein (DUF1697 family)
VQVETDRHAVPSDAPRFAAFVRNIMVGRNGLTADVMRHIVVEAGGREPRSHLATGNLTFSAPTWRVEAIGKAIEDSIESVLGRREDVFIRTLVWLTAAVRADPFAAVVAQDVYERCVTFLPTDTRVSLTLPVETPRGDAVLFARRDDDVLSITRLVGGRPGQPGRYLESAEGIRVTTRNWNTIERIVRLEG